MVDKSLKMLKASFYQLRRPLTYFRPFLIHFTKLMPKTHRAKLEGYTCLSCVREGRGQLRKLWRKIDPNKRVAYSARLVTGHWSRSTRTCRAFAFSDKGTAAMPPAKHTSAEEQAFMDDLLTGLDDSFFTAIPSPDPSPVKRRSPSKRLPVTPKKFQRKSPKKSVLTSVEDVDMRVLMEGAEDWNWDDMEADFLTPEKRKAPSAQSPPGYMREPCTRCIVEAVVESNVGGRYEKVCAESRH